LVAVGAIALGSLIAALSPRLLDANFSAPVELASPSSLVFFSSEGRPTDEELALRFSPVLLTGKDKRRPVTVDRFLDDSSLERVDPVLVLLRLRRLGRRDRLGRDRPEPRGGLGGGDDRPLDDGRRQLHPSQPPVRRSVSALRRNPEGPLRPGDNRADFREVRA